MSKLFLGIRIVVLVALLFLLVAAFWGIANRESTRADDGVADNYEEYRKSKPAAYTSVLLITLVVVGICVVLASILFEYRQSRKKAPRETDLPPEGEEGKKEWR